MRFNYYSFILLLILNLSCAYALPKSDPLEKLKPVVYPKIKASWNSENNLEQRFVVPEGRQILRIIGSDNVVLTTSAQIQDGKYIADYSTGLTWFEVNYVNGKRNGEAKLYFDNGKVFCVAQYTDDILDNLAYIDDTGQVLGRFKLKTAENYSVFIPKLSASRYYELLERALFEHICNNRDLTPVCIAIDNLFSVNSDLLQTREDFLNFLISCERSVNISLADIRYNSELINPLLFSCIPKTGYDRYLQLICELDQLTPSLDYLKIILNQLAINEDGNIDIYLARLKDDHPTELQTYDFYSSYVQGNRLYDKAQYSQAIDPLRNSSTSVDVYYPDANYRDRLILRLAECYSRSGDYKQSIVYFSSVFDRSDFSQNPDIEIENQYYWYAFALEQCSDFWQAAQYYSRLTGEARSLKALGLIYINNLESPRNALAVIEQCKSINLDLYNYLLDEFEKKFGQLDNMEE